MPMCLIKVSLGSPEDQSRLTPKKKVMKGNIKFLKGYRYFFLINTVKKYFRLAILSCIGRVRDNNYF